MGGNSTVLPTAQLLAVPNGQFRPFTPFTIPNPSPNTGVHRFIYALYTQPARFNTAGFESVGMEAETQNWNVSYNTPGFQLRTLANKLLLAFEMADTAWARTCYWRNLFYY
jgi:hypothetical protein